MGLQTCLSFPWQTRPVWPSTWVPPLLLSTDSQQELAPPCLISTSASLSPSPSDVPNWLPRKSPLTVAAANNSMEHFSSLSKCQCCVELFMCIFSCNLQKKKKTKKMVLSSPHGWEYCHHIFFPLFYSHSVFKYFPHGVRNHDLERNTGPPRSKTEHTQSPFPSTCLPMQRYFLLSRIVLLIVGL